MVWYSSLSDLFGAIQCSYHCIKALVKNFFSSSSFKLPSILSQHRKMSNQNYCTSQFTETPSEIDTQNFFLHFFMHSSCSKINQIVSHYYPNICVEFLCDRILLNFCQVLTEFMQLYQVTLKTNTTTFFILLTFKMASFKSITIVIIGSIVLKKVCINNKTKLYFAKRNTGT